MSELIEKLKRALAFDEGKRIGPPESITHAYGHGMVAEHARTKAVMLAVIEVSEAAIDFQVASDMRCWPKVGARKFHADPVINATLASDALTQAFDRLDAEVDKLVRK